MGDLSQLLSECASFVKTAWLAAAHAVTHHSGGPPACSGSPPGPKRRALAAWVQKRCCAGALVPAQSRRFHRVLTTQAGGLKPTAPGASGVLGAAAAAAGDLFVLQLVSARLSWKERATVRALRALRSH